MSRYLLDTNILVYVVVSDFDNLSKEVKEVLLDYESQLYTSSISVLELLQLHRIRKIQHKKYTKTTDWFHAIENEFYIKILPFTKQHIETLAELKIADKHNDPFDHSIISQAITEQLILISSDRKFKEYTNQKLHFLFNRR